jgi:hypothetical protein
MLLTITFIGLLLLLLPLRLLLHWLNGVGWRRRGYPLLLLHLLHLCLLLLM